MSDEDDVLTLKAVKASVMENVRQTLALIDWEELESWGNALKAEALEPHASDYESMRASLALACIIICHDGFAKFEHN